MTRPRTGRPPSAQDCRRRSPGEEVGPSSPRASAMRGMPLLDDEAAHLTEGARDRVGREAVEDAQNARVRNRRGDDGDAQGRDGGAEQADDEYVTRRRRTATETIEGPQSFRHALPPGASDGLADGQAAADEAPQSRRRPPGAAMQGREPRPRSGAPGRTRATAPMTAPTVAAQGVQQPARAPRARPDDDGDDEEDVEEQDEQHPSILSERREHPGTGLGGAAPSSGASPRARVGALGW